MATSVSDTAARKYNRKDLCKKKGEYLIKKKY